MMLAPRLISLLRIPCRFDTISNRSILCASSSRFLGSEPKWQCFSTEQRSSCSFNSLLHRPILEQNKYQLGPPIQILRCYAQNVKGEKTSDSKLDSSKSQSSEEIDDLEQFQKLSLYQKIKAMYRDYWYVLGPVHVASSLVFFGIFYYIASSGVDIIAILESLHFSEKVVNSLKDSSAGYIAIAYALYKIFTPIRYTVTLGGTTWAIRFLRARGLIKPRRPMKEAKENVQNIISAMKLPEKERQKFLEDKGMPRIGKAVTSLGRKPGNKSEK